ncbi:sugar phosphate isomerase/epimerase family protein [Kaistia terrae]|uniref:Sugar phosphate isomerase/epimerase family protein n=1 Tax=Kaistia terrae TaxID=537017 RepID=A0ABW0PNS6_9HYPH|nr:sugar phosphate isomerase/epimerase family protein [Kaistia terrae]MCX5580102.1 sugar phosphate isomerase/epimerase [Kaistia terrae]
MKNKLGVHAQVWVGGWSHEEAARAIASTAAIGYDYIEAPALDPSLIDIDFTRRELEKSGLGITTSLGLDDSCDISSGDAGKKARGEAHLMQVVKTTRDLGGTHITGILYSGFQKYFTAATPEGVAGAVEVLQRVAEEAAKSNITLGLEVVNRYETNVINTAAQGVELCKRVGMANVKVHLDCYHMNIEEADAERAIIDTGDYLGYFHTGESHRGYLGTGSIDFTKIFRGLVKANYQGPICFESFSSAVAGEPLTGILGIWRNLWTDSTDLCRHAMEFTQAQMHAAQQAQAINTRVDW